MSGGVIVMSNREAATVYGSHGGSSAVQWKRLCTAGFFAGPFDSFEYNRVPAGAVIGEHRHDVTEEIYFIVSGTAEMVSGGRREPVGPGDIAVTGLDGTHGITATGDDDMEFLVVEVLPPRVLAALHPDQVVVGGNERDASALSILSVGEGRTVDLGQHLNGAWGPVGTSRLAPGTELDVDTDEYERGYYVLSGSATLRFDGQEIPLPAGTAASFTRGAKGVVVAGASEGVELFHVAVEA